MWLSADGISSKEMSPLSHLDSNLRGCLAKTMSRVAWPFHHSPTRKNEGRCSSGHAKSCRWLSSGP